MPKEKFDFEREWLGARIEVALVWVLFLGIAVSDVIVQTPLAWIELPMAVTGLAVSVAGLVKARRVAERQDDGGD